MFGGLNNHLTIVFNGEIYNFVEIKSELNDYEFITKTDTEVILASYERWGRNCVNKFNGMFSFAIWDNTKSELFIARDRLGVKPLYYSICHEGLIFASEIRALLKSGLVSKEICLSSLQEYMMYQTVHAPNTLMRNVKQLMPGQFALFSKNKGLEIHTYWDISQVTKCKNSLTYNDVLKDTREFLSEAVKRRMIVDVPLGAFLSGGIDSTAIVGLMSQHSNLPINTFTIGFHNEKFDESHSAIITAQKFKTNHTSYFLKASDLMDFLPEALRA